MITISIITATYNVEICLENLIKSIIPQKTSEIEFIIIDGGSKDNTLNIIKKHDTIIDYYVSEPDNGIYDAWNKGIKAAKGEWVMFLGADDILLPDAIDTYISYINNIQSDDSILSSKVRMVSSAQQEIRVVGEKWNWYKHQKGKYSLAHPGMLHKKTLFSQFGFYDTNFKICADSEFLLRVDKNIKGGFVDLITVNMQVGGMSDSYKALYESFLIRKKNNSLPYFSNFIRLFYRFIWVTLSKIKKHYIYA